MKNKLIFFLMAVVFSTSLDANSLNTQDENRFYYNFHKQLEDFFNNNQFINPSFNKTFSSYPKMDMIENKDSYILKFELAGMDKKNIKVSIDQKNILSISGVRDEYKKENKDGVIRQERHFGSFQRAISLPQDINKDKIDVNYKSGILSVKIAKDMKKKIKKSVRILPIN